VRQYFGREFNNGFLSLAAPARNISKRLVSNLIQICRHFSNSSYEEQNWIPVACNKSFMATSESACVHLRLSDYKNRAVCSQTHVNFNTDIQARWDSGGSSRGIAPLKPTTETLFIMILYNSENNIRDVKPFCRPLFCHSNVWSILHLSYSSEAVVRLDHQRLLKSPPLATLAGSAPGETDGSMTSQMPLWQKIKTYELGNVVSLVDSMQQHALVPKLFHSYCSFWLACIVIKTNWLHFQNDGR